jgi:hypothetical protein
MFVGDSADMCGVNFLLMSMGDQAEGLVCADPVTWTPIGMSGNFTILFIFYMRKFPGLFSLRIGVEQTIHRDLTVFLPKHLFLKY